MPPRINIPLACILSLFLVAGPVTLFSSPFRNPGFGAGFVAAAVVIFLYRLMLLRRFEHQVRLKGEPYGTAAGRAAYSTLSIFAVLACAAVFTSVVLQTGFEVDAYRLLGALTGLVFLVFVWLFMFYQNQIEE